MQSNTMIPLAQVSDQERATFIKMTYMHLAIAVLGFIAVELVIFQTGLAQSIASALTGGYTWLIVLGVFMFVSYQAEKWAMSSTSQGKQYAGLGLYIIMEAVIFVPLLFMARYYAEGPVIMQAAILTLALFLGLTAVVLTTRKDFSFLRNILMVGGFIALGLIVLSILFGFNLGLFFSFAMVALAAGSILYQTSNIVHKYHTGQHVAAALGLFASLMLLFWYILRIVMAFSGDD